MKYRTGNDYWVTIGKEYSTEADPNAGYGTGQMTAGSMDMVWTDLSIFPDKLEIGGERAVIETGAKTLSGIPTTYERIRGNYNYNITLSGILSKNHEILLEGMNFSYNGKTYTLVSIPEYLPSFVILRVWNDPPDITTPEKPKYLVDKFLGCQLTKLTLSGASGDMVKYEATFNIYSYEREISQIITGDKPTFNDIMGRLFNFGDMLFTTQFGDETKTKSFSLSMGYEIPDDAIQYMNSLKRNPAIPLRFTGEYKYVNNYHKNRNEVGIEDLINNTFVTEESFTIQGAKNWSFELYGQITGYTLADPDKALFENNITYRLAQLEKETILTITIT